MKKAARYLFVAVMVVSILCTSVMAMEYSNAYVRSGEGYISVKGGGKISVEYTVTGTDIMDEIGAHRVTVYRMLGSKPDTGKDELIKTYYYTEYPELMGKDDVLYGHAIELTVKSGQKYYATFTFYASLDGRGDDMSLVSYVVTA